MALIPQLQNKWHNLSQRFGSSKAIMAAMWVVAGAGGTQGIRLLSNLLLTRLLFPEVFGIMAIVYAVLTFFGQLSDVGLREGVVNSKRINDPTFMRSAWTLQVIRSGVIALCAALLAIPVAQYYKQDILAPILAMVGFCMFLSGFKSIALLAYDKRLDLKTQVALEVGSQVAGLCVTLAWVLFVSADVWALVAGQLASTLVEVTLSYVLFTGHHSRFAWEKPAVHELFNFGKWILVSSAISFIIVQGDRLIMGAWLTMGELGFYSLATNWAALVTMVAFTLSTRVLHPYFRENLDNAKSFAQIHKVRLRLNIAYMCICCAVAILGEQIIKILYDDRYISAGWMLQILAVGQMGRVFTITLRPFLLAREDSFSQMATSAISAIILVIFLIVGGYFAGSAGLIIAYAASGIAIHPIMIYFANKHGYHCMRSDMGLIFITVAITICAWFIFDSPVIDMVSQISHGDFFQGGDTPSK